LPIQFFNSFFKTLIGKEIAVELKNDVALTGEWWSHRKSPRTSWSPALTVPPLPPPLPSSAFPGKLHSVDQYLNIKLTDVQVVDGDRYPQLQAMANCFIRGSVVRYVQIPKDEVDTEMLQDAARQQSKDAK
jgi:U6 snRNA-associated Sm-like protein LSm2